MDIIKDLPHLNEPLPFLKSLSPASTGDIPPSPRSCDERIELPMPKSHSLPASPHHMSASCISSFLKEKDSGILSESKDTIEPIEAKNSSVEMSKPPTPPPSALPVKLSSNQQQQSQQFCLRWNNYQTNLTNVFDELLQNESFVDVTLACEGQSIKAHKMVLSACSPYFQTLFYENPCQHPIIIMRDVRWNELKAIIEFMYKGEINVSQDQINPLLKVAEMLKIRGLAEVNTTETVGDVSALANATLVGDETASRKSPSLPKKPRLHVNTEKLLEVNLSSTAGRKRSRTPSPAGTAHRKEKQKQSQHPHHQQQQLQSQQSAPQQHPQSHQYQQRQQLIQESPSPSMSSSALRNPFASHLPTTTSVNHSSSSNSAGTATGSSGSSGPCNTNAYSITTPPTNDALSLSALGINHVDEMEIKPEIAEMIREEERAKLIEGSHPWIGGSTTPSVADSYQYQLQSMWQKCWNTNQQNLVQQLRFRERGPLKSWRPESMAEAIFSVLKEGLSLSQAARKYDIPYPTFVLYANRVHNMLGPSLDGGSDPRPKARGRPQRILLGMWPEELIRSVIKAVVFRDYREIKEDTVQMYANGGGGSNAPPAAHSSQYGLPNTPTNSPSSNGYHNKIGYPGAGLSAETSNSLTTMAETIRRQMQMSQQSPSPSLNMYKSPAFLQRSEMEDPMLKRSSADHIPPNKVSDSLPDLNALGLMGIPGLNVIPQGRSQHSISHTQQSAQHLQPSGSFSNRDIKDSMQQHMSIAMSQAAVAAAAAASRPQMSYAQPRSSSQSSSSSYHHKYQNSSPYPMNYKTKSDSTNYKFPDKRMLEGLTPGIDFEAIANGLLQKTHKSSPRFEDFFPTPEVNDLFPANSTPETSANYNTKDHPIAKIKLEQPHSSDNREE